MRMEKLSSEKISTRGRDAGQGCMMTVVPTLTRP